MIISASRRTDIPAFYGTWFVERLRAGFCLVPNPFNRRQVARTSLRQEDVDAIVFWTRNPRPFLGVLDELDRGGYRYVFLFTLTDYGPPLEPHAPGRAEAVAAFRSLAERIGPDRVVWRYDPVVLGPGLSVDDHLERFRGLASELVGATRAVKISFVDLYRKTRRRLAQLEPGYCVDPAASPRLVELVCSLREIADAAGMCLETCAEERDFSELGVAAGSCIDAELLSRLTGRELPTAKDPGQRTHCRCAASRDIGMTDSCLHGCAYCYATRSHEVAVLNSARHDPTASSLL